MEKEKYEELIARLNVLNMIIDDLSVKIICHINNLEEPKTYQTEETYPFLPKKLKGGHLFHELSGRVN